MPGGPDFGRNTIRHTFTRPGTFAHHARKTWLWKEHHQAHIDKARNSCSPSHEGLALEGTPSGTHSQGTDAHHARRTWLWKVHHQTHIHKEQMLTMPGGPGSQSSDPQPAHRSLLGVTQLQHHQHILALGAEPGEPHSYTHTHTHGAVNIGDTSLSISGFYIYTHTWCKEYRRHFTVNLQILHLYTHMVQSV